MKYIKILSLLLILFITSCRTYVPPPPPNYFTQEIRERVQSKNSKNIEKIQYYNHQKIVLVHKTLTEDENFTGGEVKFQDGYYYYTITFPFKTPAIAKELDDNRLKVFFESGADRYLTFGVGKNTKETYQLFGDAKDDGFYVNFEGKSFKVTNGSRALLIYKKNLNITEKADERTVKGVLID
jgi:hypothetical protein